MSPGKTENRVCVYCSEAKEFQRGKRGGDFNSEHVVPEAFASVRNSLTLIGVVCRDCNGELGRTIDQTLTRGTVEGLRRFLEKQKPIEKISELDRRKLNVSLEKASDRSLKDAYVNLTHEGGELKQQYAVQLVIKLKDSENWLTVQRSDFAKFIATNPNVDLSEFKILGPSPGTEEFFEEMQAVWPGIKLVGDLEPTDHISDLVADYGPEEQRALAKISFNYFCYITQRSPELALAGQFDPIRKFIRYGQPPGWQAVLPREEPIVNGDTITRRRTNGHLVTFDLEKSKENGGKVEAVSLVSIFNDLTWRVVLQPDVQLSLGPSIHLWDHEENECVKLSAKKVVPQQNRRRIDTSKIIRALSLQIQSF